VGGRARLLLFSDQENLAPEDVRPAQLPATLTDLIAEVGWETLGDDPNDPPRVLASLDLPLYLTTNPDSMMVEALRAAGKSPARELCPWNAYLDGLPSRFVDDPAYEPTPEAPLVHHLLGTDEEIDSLVVTEDHYLDYLVRISAEMERIPDYIWSALTNSSLLFLGYSLDDWEFRVLMRGLVATRDRRRRLKHVGVQLEMAGASEEETQAVQTFLQQYFQESDINIYWGTPAQFVAELREQMEGAPPARRTSSRGATLALLVVEPPPAGAHDLARVLELTHHFEVPALVLLNKADLSAPRAAEIAALPIMAHLPYNPIVTEAMANGQAVTAYTDAPVTQALHAAWAAIKARLALVTS
jgi:hypothetical protein